MRFTNRTRLQTQGLHISRVQHGSSDRFLLQIKRVGMRVWQNDAPSFPPPWPDASSCSCHKTTHTYSNTDEAPETNSNKCLFETPVNGDERVIRCGLDRLHVALFQQDPPRDTFCSVGQVLFISVEKHENHASAICAQQCPRSRNIPEDP